MPKLYASIPPIPAIKGTNADKGEEGPKKIADDRVYSETLRPLKMLGVSALTFRSNNF